MCYWNLKKPLNLSFVRLFVPFLLLLLLVVLPAPAMATTNVSLGFSSLPSAQGWSYENGVSGVPDVNLYSVNGSSLMQNTIGWGYAGFAYLLYTPLDAQASFTMTVVARVLNYEMQSSNNPYGFMIGVVVAGEFYDLGISPNNIRGGASGATLFSNSIDVTQFHEYRIEGTPGSGFTVFVDNVSLGTAPAAAISAPDYLFLGDGTAGANAQVEITHFSFVQITNQNPVCSNAVASVQTLWPANHAMVPVSVLQISDPDDDAVSVSITSIMQDEPTNGLGDGDTFPDGQGIGTSVAEIRAERAGNRNGRVYHINFVANDGQGGSCNGEVIVMVPRNQSANGSAVDDGASYDSTTP